MSDIVKILLVAFFSSSLFAQEIDRNLTSLDSIVAIVNEGVVLNSQLNSQIQIVTERAKKDGFALPSEEIVKEQKEREKEYQLTKDKIIRTITSFK